MKNTFNIFKKWFLESFVYYHLEAETLELTKQLRDGMRNDDMRAYVYIRHKHKDCMYPWIVVVYRQRRRVFENKYYTKNIGKVVKAVCMQFGVVVDDVR